MQKKSTSERVFEAFREISREGNSPMPFDIAGKEIGQSYESSAIVGMIQERVPDLTQRQIIGALGVLCQKGLIEKYAFKEFLEDGRTILTVLHLSNAETIKLHENK